MKFSDRARWGSVDLRRHHLAGHGYPHRTGHLGGHPSDDRSLGRTDRGPHGVHSPRDHRERSGHDHGHPRAADDPRREHHAELHQRRVQPVSEPDASAQGTARIPQDLTSFIAQGTITQAILDDPNTVLRNAIAHQTIISTTQISISTSVTPPIVAGGGVDNIAFLVNTGPDTIGGPKGPNAQTFQMNATFWIETVERVIIVPPFQPGHAPIPLPLEPSEPGHLAPKLTINPGRVVTKPTQIKLHFSQIQYSQVVFLNFNGLSWPHVSVATLVSATPLPVPPTAWG
jgi:hypothetical protein